MIDSCSGVKLVFGCCFFKHPLCTNTLIETHPFLQFNYKLLCVRCWKKWFGELEVCGKLLIFKKLRSCSYFSNKICLCACLHAHMLTVNLVSSQPVTPCRCFWFHGGRCTCVIPEQEEVKAGQVLLQLLGKNLQCQGGQHVRSGVCTCCSEHWCGQPCVKGSEGPEPLWRVCDGCLPAHAIKL